MQYGANCLKKAWAREKKLHGMTTFATLTKCDHSKRSSITVVIVNIFNHVEFLTQIKQSKSDLL